MRAYQNRTNPRRFQEGLDIMTENKALLNNVHPPDWVNPKVRDRYHLVIIGGGPAGITAARQAAARGAKVALIERNRLGGNSVNAGSIPSKSLIRTSRLYADMINAGDFGVPTPADIREDFDFTMQRLRRIVTRVSRKISPAELSAEKIDIFFGQGRFLSPDTIGVGDQTLRFGRALITTGSRSTTPDIPGLAETGYLTNENVFDLDCLPRRLMVIGGGPLGCELAQAFCRLGSKVILVHREPKFLPGEERDAAQLLSDSLARDGVEIHLNTMAVGARSVNGLKHVDLLSNADKSILVVDEILTGIGRSPNVENLDLEKAGVPYDKKTGIAVNDFMRTKNARIYAAGDVCLSYKYTHTARASANIAVLNALFGGRKRFSKLIIPWCTYTDPEISHVGLYVDEANRKDISVKTITILMQDIDRAIADSEDDGFVKIHVREGTDRIMGATIVARHAGEILNEITLAMQAGIGLSALGQVIHAYPTQAAAISLAADTYNKTRIKTFYRILDKLRLTCSGRL
jgi:pyruvate/2-oxoglutarate dehydrogenase complex dihydrolipoamide dehydrogenase (E3) component